MPPWRPPKRIFRTLQHGISCLGCSASIRGRPKCDTQICTLLWPPTGQHRPELCLIARAWDAVLTYLVHTARTYTSHLSQSSPSCTSSREHAESRYCLRSQPGQDQPETRPLHILSEGLFGASAFGSDRAALHSRRWHQAVAGATSTMALPMLSWPELPSPGALMSYSACLLALAVCPGRHTNCTAAAAHTVSRCTTPPELPCHDAWGQQLPACSLDLLHDCSNPQLRSWRPSVA
jgi:hypothetical protein